MKPVVLLYNPAAPYFSMPLQFLALASAIDRGKYDVQVIDARLEPHPAAAHEKVRALLPRTACLGVSVITGTPIRDAVAVTDMVKRSGRPVPVVWGGWHPSILPEQCLREGGADYCVVGQGELTFAELLERLEDGSPADDVPGLAFLKDRKFVQTEERKFVDINRFPAYDYDLLHVEAYFRLKRRRQLDFYSSQGCPYRCAFCADPEVYGRRWSGLKSSRMLTDVSEAVRRHRVDDVVFQDENFFANRNRVGEFCRGVHREGARFSWVATSRADQVAPLDDVFLREMREANLRKVVIGAESGSQQMLEFMKKDTLAEEAILSAEKLSRHGIRALFNFILGFPEEPFDEVKKSLEAIREIKRIDSRFEFGLFYFTPYPGTELYGHMRERGIPLPGTLHEWSDVDFERYAGQWLGPDRRRHVDRFRFYVQFGTETGRSWLSPLRRLAAARVRQANYLFPVEHFVARSMRAFRAERAP